jgi:hypothetical protein
MTINQQWVRVALSRSLKAIASSPQILEPDRKTKRPAEFPVQFQTPGNSR